MHAFEWDRSGRRAAMRQDDVGPGVPAGLIRAAFPPDLDGIGDYTGWMAKTLAEPGHRVTVFTRIGEVRAVPGFAIFVPFYDPARPESFGELVAL